MPRMSDDVLHNVSVRLCRDDKRKLEDLVQHANQRSDIFYTDAAMLRALIRRAHKAARLDRPKSKAHGHG